MVLLFILLLIFNAMLRKFYRVVIGIFLLATVLHFLLNRGSSNQLLSYAYMLAFTAAFWLGNGWLVDLIDRKMSWLEKPVTRLVTGVLVMVVYTSGVAMLLLYGIGKLHGFEVSPEQYRNSLLISILVTLIISLILHAREFLLNWRKVELEKEQLARAQAASRYESLKSQLNPHFLFNSLNVLSELVYHSADDSARFIGQLSHVYRYVLENSQAELVPLEEELSFLKSYLSLHQIRHGEALQVHWQVDKTDGLALPPLALQLLAENALKHNTLEADAPLNLSLRQEGDYLVVENNLQKRGQTLAGTGIGLKNLRERYQYLSKTELKIREEAGCFQVWLPLLNVPEPACVS